MCYVMHAKFIFLDQVFKLDWRFEINVNSYFFSVLFSWQLHDWIDLLNDFLTTNLNEAQSLDFRLLNCSLYFWYFSFPCTVYWWHPTSRVPTPLWSSSQCWDWLPHTDFRETFSNFTGDAAQGLCNLWRKQDHLWRKGKKNLSYKKANNNFILVHHH